MNPFIHVGLPCRVVFGPGRLAELGAEIDRLGCRRVLLCCTPGRAAEVEALAATLGVRVAGVSAIAEPFVPYTVAEKGRAAARSRAADGLVAFGGGTAIGLAKAIALEAALPIVAVVTTYSGSEATAIQGIVRDGERTTYVEDGLLPKTILYDPELTLDLPLALSIPSGFNAMAHGVGALLGKTADPIACMYAEEGIRTMSRALAGIARAPRDVEARGQALVGAFLTASTLMGGGVVLHHKIVHVLGGGFGLSHAHTHTIVLPHSTGYQRDAAPAAMRRIARAFGDEAGDAAGAIYDLLAASGAPTALRDIGMPEDGLDAAADRIAADPYFSPRPVDRASIRALLDDIWRGRRPEAR